jgi:selenium donor protein
MGGRALFALNVVGFPSNRLSMSVLEKILNGAHDKAREAGIAIIGGHTVDDTEPKFGLAVTGVVHPDKILTNRTAKPGDVLILTKPIGTGILSTALKQGMLDDDQKRLLIDTMAALNKTAADAMQEIGVNACTDITGFGLIGHLLEMMQGSKTSATVHADSIPILHGVEELAVSMIIPGGTKDNFSFTAPHVRYESGLSAVMRLILNDAQTSGGLLISVPDANAHILVEKLKKHGVESTAVIGRVTDQAAEKIFVDR